MPPPSPPALFSNTSEINVLLLKLLVGTPFEWEEKRQFGATLLPASSPSSLWLEWQIYHILRKQQIVAQGMHWEVNAYICVWVVVLSVLLHWSLLESLQVMN